MSNKHCIYGWSALLGLLCLTASASFAAPHAAPAAPEKQDTATPEAMKYEKSAKAAFSKAKSSKKIVFLLFTNERRCAPCKMLQAQILSKPEFATALQEIAVPVKYALQGRVPRDISDLMVKYSAGGTPCIIYTDASGKKLGQSGYHGGDIQSYIAEAKRYHEQAYGTK